MGLCGKGVGAKSIWCQCCERWCHQRCLCEQSCGSATEIGSGRRYSSLEIVDSFHYLGDVISCGGGVESAVRDRTSCAWSKWREMASLLVNHSIPLEERAKVYCVSMRPALLYAAET